MVYVYSEMYIESNGKSFKEGSEILLEHIDGRVFVCIIETIARNLIMVTSDEETFNIFIENIVSIKDNN